MADEATLWFAEHSAGAPEVLRARAGEFLARTSGSSTVARLAEAGEMALSAAIAVGEDRAAALDLLAGDALITLALLAQADLEPAALGASARALRDQAAS